MGILSSQLLLRKAATMGSSPSTPNIGGPISSTPITGITIGEIFYNQIVAATGQQQWGKIFFLNDTYSLDTLNVAKVSINNFLSPITGQSGLPSLIHAVSGNTSDNSSYKIRHIGLDGSGNPYFEDVVMNGTTSVATTGTFSLLVRSEYRLVSGGALTPANGTITISITSGFIPGYLQAGLHSATSEVLLGIESVINGSDVAANPITAPVGYTFQQPWFLPCSNSGNLPPGSAQGIWCQLTTIPGIESSPDVQLNFVIQGEDETAGPGVIANIITPRYSVQNVLGTATITESWGWVESGAGVPPGPFEVSVTESWGWSEENSTTAIPPINITPNSAWSTFIAYQATFVGDGPGSQPLPVIPPPVMGVSSLPASGPIGTISIPTVGRIWEIIPTAPLNFDWHESKSARLENGQIPAPTRMYWCGMGQTSYQLVAHKVPIADAIQIEAMLNGAQSAVTFYTADHLTITGDPTTVQRTTDSNNVTCELTVEVFPPEG